jgi:hypothetical protein
VTAEFDRAGWLALCEREADAAAKCSSLSHTLYVQAFSRAIDSAVLGVPEIHRSEAMKIATESFEYATAAERAQEQHDLAEMGWCSHGIQLGCCPAGCGSF